jgi:hypothetical protein
MKWMRFRNSIPLTALCLTLAVGCSDDGEDSPAAGGTGGRGGTAGTSGTGGGGRGGTGGSSAGTSGNGAGGSAGSAGSGGSAGSAGAGGSAAAGSAGSAGNAGSAGSSGGDEPDAGGGQDDVVTYTADIQPILLLRCSPCHATDNNGGHNAASDYDDAVERADDIIDELESGGMPESGSGNQGCDGGDPGDPGCVTVEEFELIEAWVEGDTPE